MSCSKSYSGFFITPAIIDSPLFLFLAPCLGSNYMFLLQTLTSNKQTNMINWYTEHLPSFYSRVNKKIVLQCVSYSLALLLYSFAVGYVI